MTMNETIVTIIWDGCNFKKVCGYEELQNGGLWGQKSEFPSSSVFIFTWFLKSTFMFIYKNRFEGICRKKTWTPPRPSWIESCSRPWKRTSRSNLDLELLITWASRGFDATEAFPVNLAATVHFTSHKLALCSDFIEEKEERGEEENEETERDKRGRRLRSRTLTGSERSDWRLREESNFSMSGCN